MSALQWIVLVILAIPILFYIGVVVVLTHVTAKIMQKPIFKVPLGYHPWRAIGAIGVLAIIVWGIIPLCGTVYDWAFVENDSIGVSESIVKDEPIEVSEPIREDDSIEVSEVATLDGGQWWYADFERAVICGGELRLASSIMWSSPSPDCDGNPTRHLCFRFDEKVPEDAYILKIQFHPRGHIVGARGEEVVLDFEALQFSPSSSPTQARLSCE
ncbi:MAG: hypothetical protein OXC95_03045 [Dehalococcoidia bacterium]|nr:hypothetical protein [Dehalococcoidia bacterium]